MDEYLSDKEQVERLRQWWRENGWFLIGGAALGLLALYGYNQFFAYGIVSPRKPPRRTRDQARKPTAALPRLPPRGSPRCAASSRTTPIPIRPRCSWRAPRSSPRPMPPPRSCVSRWSRATTPSWRWSRVFGSRACSLIASQHQEALALLDVPEPGQFAGRIAEIRGDIHVALGETDAARTDYLEAMVAPGAELLDRGFLQMKLADLPGPAPTPAAAPEAPAADQARLGAGRRPDPAEAPQTAPASPRCSRERARERMAAAHRGTGAARGHAERRALGARIRASRRPSSPRFEATLDIDQACGAARSAGSRNACGLGCARRPTARAFSPAPTTARSRRSMPRAATRFGRSRPGLALTAGPGFGDGTLIFGTADGSCWPSMPRRARSAGAKRSAARCSRRRPSAQVSSPCELSMAACAASRPSNGSTLWTVEQSLPSLTLRGNTAPRVAGTLVVSGFNNGRVGAYEIADGDPAWEVAIATDGRSERASVDVCGLSIVGNDVYVVGYHGRAVGIDLETGVVLWQQDLSSYAGLGADINNVYVTSDFDAVVALERDSRHATMAPGSLAAAGSHGADALRQHARRRRLRRLSALAFARQRRVLGARARGRPANHRPAARRRAERLRAGETAPSPPIPCASTKKRNAPPCCRPSR